MNDVDRQQRNEERLKELHPWMRNRVMGLLVDLEHDGWKPRIQDAWRSPEDQKKAFESGHSKLLYGFHNVTGPNGEKEAFACDILREDDSVLVAEKEYCIALAHFADKQGLKTGLTWGLESEMAITTAQAALAKNLKATVKIGWDPTHVEPAHDWLDKLKSGWRPILLPGVPPQTITEVSGQMQQFSVPSDSVLVKRDVIETLRRDMSNISLNIEHHAKAVGRLLL